MAGYNVSCMYLPCQPLLILDLAHTMHYHCHSHPAVICLFFLYRDFQSNITSIAAQYTLVVRNSVSSIREASLIWEQLTVVYVVRERTHTRHNTCSFRVSSGDIFFPPRTFIFISSAFFVGLKPYRRRECNGGVGAG